MESFIVLMCFCLTSTVIVSQSVDQNVLEDVQSSDNEKLVSPPKRNIFHENMMLSKRLHHPSFEEINHPPKSYIENILSKQETIAKLDENGTLPFDDIVLQEIDDEEIDFNIVLQPNIKQCFYYLPAGNFTLHVKVFEGTSPQFTAFLNNPDGYTLGQMEKGKRSINRVINVPVQFITMTHVLCLDNSNYPSSRIVVSISFSMDKDARLRRRVSSLYYDVHQNNLAVPELVYGLKRAVFLASVDQLEDLIRDMSVHLKICRLFELLDRHNVEYASYFTNAWSLMELIFMIVVGLIQVFLIRSLFDTGSKFNRFWQFTRPSMRFV